MFQPARRLTVVWSDSTYGLTSTSQMSTIGLVPNIPESRLLISSMPA